MTRIDDLLLEAVSEHELDVPELSQEETERITKLALSKLTSAPKKTGKKRLVFILAAAITLLSTGIAFAAIRMMTVSEVFEPVFVEQNEVGEVVPLKEKTPLVETAGMVVEQTKICDNLSVTLRGVVGDNDSVHLLIEVCDINGDPISSDGGQGQARFEKAYLHIDAGQDGAFEATGQYCSTVRIDDGSEPSKMTFLIQEFIDPSIVPEIAGNKVTLELSGLSEQGMDDVRMLTFEYGDLADLARNFPNPAEEDFCYQVLPEEVLEFYKEREETLGISILEWRPKDKDGNYISDPYLPDSGVKVPFSPDYPNTYVVAMGIFQDKFHMALVCEDKKEHKKFFDNGLTLINTKTGDTYPSGIGSSFFDPDLNWDESAFTYIDFLPMYMQTVRENMGRGYLYCTVQYTGDLTDMAFSTGGSFYFKPISEEKWRFEFDINYTNTSLIYEPSEPTRLENPNYMVDQIAVSPFTLKVSCSAATDEKLLYPADMPPVCLLMKDGSELPLTYMRSSSNSEGDLIYYAVLPVVIDPEQVSGVRVGETEISCVVSLTDDT